MVLRETSTVPTVPLPSWVELGDDVTVTITDDDSVGLVLSPAALTVDEGASGTYTVALNSRPRGNVRVTVVRTSDTDLTVSPEILSFTRSTWDTTQTVTVTAGEDSDTADDTDTLTHTASGADYGGVEAALVVTVRDNGEPAANNPATGTVTIDDTTPTVGEALTATVTNVADADGLTNPGYTYQWLRGEEAGVVLRIAGATSASYTPVAADVGKTLQVRVSFTDDANNAETLTSAPTDPVTAANIAPVFDDGATTTRSVAENTAAGTDFGAPVEAKDDDNDTLTYTLTGTDAASFRIGESGQLRTNAALDYEATPSYEVTVTVSDGTATDTIAVTINVTDVDEPPEAPSAAPTVASATADSLIVNWVAPDSSGRPPIAGYDLRYRVKTPQGSWIDGPQNVDATSATITGLAASQTYEVQVRARNDEGASAWSPAVDGTTNAAANTPATGTVTIDDTTPTVGETLSATVTNVADADGLAASPAYTYAWLRGAPGATPVVIAGADSSTYTPVAADIGQTLQARVSFTDDNGNAETLTSQATAVVTQRATVSVTVTGPDRVPETDGQAVFTLARTGAATAALTVKVRVTQEGDVLVSADDYANPVDVVFAAGAAEATLTVAIDDDLAYDPDLAGADARVGGRVAATLEADSGYGLGTPSAHTVEVTDDEDSPLTASAAVEPAPVPEGAGAATVTLTVETAPGGRQPTQPYNVFMDLVSDTATADEDFRAETNDIEVPAADFAREGTVWRATATVTIVIYDDNVAEGNETFFVEFYFAPGFGPAPPRGVTVTIADDDIPRVVLGARTLTVEENRSAQYTVALATALSGEATVVVSGFADTDLTVTPSTLDFDASNWASGFTVTVAAGDDENRDDETVALAHTLTGYGGVAAPTLAVTVLDDDVDDRDVDYDETCFDRGEEGTPFAEVKAWVGESDGFESDGVDTAGVNGFSVGLSNCVAENIPVTLVWSTVDETATGSSSCAGGGDYEHVRRGEIVIPAGQNHGQGRVQLCPDRNDNEGAETFLVRIDALQAEGHADRTDAGEADTMTILDEGGDYHELFVRDATVTEASGAELAFVVELDRPSTYPISVNYRTEDGSATAGTDYVAARGTLEFAAGQTALTVVVAVLDDTVDDAGETMTLRLAAEASGAFVADGVGTGTITNSAEAAALRVADARAREGAGAAIEFTVTLAPAATGPVTVDYATADGTATAGEDYTAASGTLVFAPGETALTVAVAVLDDAHDEGEESFVLRLSNASGAVLADSEAVGTIVNSDHMPKAWLARFGRTVTGQVLDAVEARLEAPRAAGGQATLAGQALASWNDDGGANDAGAPGIDAADRATADAIRSWLAGAGTHERDGGAYGEDARARFESRVLSGRELMSGTSFALTRGSAESGGFAALWGRGAMTRFDGREGDLTLDGEVMTGLLGADWAAERWTAGLAVGHSTGAGGYRGPAGSGELEATLTGVYPYAGLTLTDRLSGWAAGGYGAGEVRVRPEGQAAMSADLTMTMGAAGMRSELLTPESGDGLALALKGDARFTRTSSSKAKTGSMEGADADVWLVRTGIEGARRFALGDEDGATVTPSFELGVRLDGGDAETGVGADMGGGLAFADPRRGLAFESSARGLIAHEASGFREWGASVSFAYRPRPETDRGLALSLTQSWGASPSGGMDALLGRETFAGLAANDDSGRFEASSRLEGELGYGLAAFGGAFTGTPNIGFGLSDNARDYRLGWRLTSAVPGDPGFEVSLDATRREAANAAAEHGVMLRAVIRW